MAFNALDTFIGRSFAEYGEFSEGEADLFKALVQPGDVVLDIGANIGAHTLVFSNLVGPTGTVLAFEPQRLIYYMLCSNVVTNGIINTTCLQNAVGSEIGRIDVPEFDFSRPNNFGALELDQNDAGVSQGVQKFSVKLTTIDSFNLPRCAFVKIDVEGMETKVILGARDTIKRLKPMLYVENDRSERAIMLINVLRSLGYHIYAHTPPLFNPDNYLKNKNNIFGNVVSVNMLCIHTEHAVTFEGRALPFGDNQEPISSVVKAKFKLTYIPPDKQVMLVTSNTTDVADNVAKETIESIKRSARVYSNVLYNHQKALDCLNMAISLYPNEMSLHEMAYDILAKEMRYTEGLEHIDKILEEGKDFLRLEHAGPDWKSTAMTATLFNKGLMLGGIGKFEEAIEVYRQAVALEPNIPAMHFNLACSLLITGQFEEGWKEYQWRMKTHKINEIQGLLPKMPIWNGENLTGGEGDKRILLYNEQGAGDMIMMMRYIPHLKAKYPSAHITLACSKTLDRLAKHCIQVDDYRQFNANHVVEIEGKWDFMCSMMSLPLFMGDVRFANIPYIKAPVSPFALPPGLNVGIAWAGNDAHGNDQDRSVYLREFRELVIPNVNLISLQKNGGKRTWPNLGQIDLMEGGDIVPMLDLMDSVEDFYDLAGLMSSLDLVITVDTAVAHLAGAMGIPTWVLIGSYPDFRWLLNREDSPWYPSVKLFRQQCPGRDWGQMFKTVRKKLIFEMLEKTKANCSVGFSPEN